MLNSTEINEFIENFECQELIPKSFDDDVLDVDLYNWYMERFQRCVEDGVPIAINAYLEKLIRHEKTNMFTISRIQLEAARIIIGG